MNNKKLYALFKDNKDIMIHMSILVKIIALLNQNIITLIYLLIVLQAKKHCVSYRVLNRKLKLSIK